MAELMQMVQGRIYFIAFSGVELVARYRESKDREHLFFSHLHYWNGFESYHSGGHCVQLGIESIREATQAEKYNLFRHELENDDV